MRQHALQNIAELLTPGTTCYYTDGSVDPTSGATGSAFVVRNEVAAWRNNDHLSSLQTELVAIDGALSHAEGGPGTSIAILTDSMAAIQTLQRRHHHDNIALITSILGRAQTLINQGTSIIIHWVPSHVGLTGNEAADTAARWATQQQHNSRTIRPSLTQIKERAKAKAKALAHNVHEMMSVTSRSMRWYMDVTDYTPLTPHPQLTRKTAVAAQRLRLGYRTLAERSPGSGTLTCQHCGTWNEEPLIHYLCSCPATTELRTPPLEGDTDGRTAAVVIVKRACEDMDKLLPLLDRVLPPR
ncbi:MAG: ribonuclease H family protein [Cyanobacteria bacterium J06553_1]